MKNFDIPNFNLTSDSSVRVVQIPDSNLGDDAVFGTESRQMFGDSEFIKIYKFLQRKFEDIFYKRGVSIQLPDDIKVVDDEEDENDVDTGKYTFLTL